MKVHVEEDGSDLVREAIEQATAAITSLISYAETRSAFARRRRLGHLSAAHHRRIVEEFEADWVRYWVVPVTESLVREAAQLADAQALHAYDAIHLASARLAAGDQDGALTVATWDTELEHAALSGGLVSLRRRR